AVALGRRFRRRGSTRHHRAIDRAGAVGTTWAVIRGREPRRRQQQYCRRGGGEGSPGRLHAIPDYVGKRRQRNDAQAQLRFDPRSRAGREHQSCALCHGSAPVGSSQDGCGVHCLCQGQSRQDQHGIGWHWKYDARLRRVVQDDGKCRPVSRALSRRAGVSRPTCPPRPALLSGEAQVFFGPLLSAIGYVRAGNSRALAVTTTTRSPVLPDIPALSETLPGYEASAWWGIVASKNTPAEIIKTLNTQVNASLADASFQARLANLGATVLAGSPADFGKLIADETEKWGKVVRAANIKAQ